MPILLACIIDLCNLPAQFMIVTARCHGMLSINFVCRQVFEFQPTLSTSFPPVPCLPACLPAGRGRSERLPQINQEIGG
jgi:hypothetical protein